VREQRERGDLPLRASAAELGEVSPAAESESASASEGGEGGEASSASVALQCPAPHVPDAVQLVQGAGGEASQRLIRDVFQRELDDPLLCTDRDAACVTVPNEGGRLAFTTDSFVVTPFEFCGGDIGSLAVYGSVNDLCVAGARPLYLSVGFILEEGLPLEALRRVLRSMRRAARAASVHIVTGDTKVVERGKGDGVYINTSGVGWLADGSELYPQQIRPGDVLLVSGDVGRHGLAILALRSGLRFEQPIESDCASILAPVRELLESGVRVRCMRDPTRGGISSAVVEIAEACGYEMVVDAASIPVRRDVAAACQVLGLDPWIMACEGRFLCWVASEHAERALALLRRHESSAAQIGKVGGERGSSVLLRTEIGTLRRLERPLGLPLPRIC